MSGLKGNLLVAQGGGPTAVINASLAGVVRAALGHLDASSRIWGARGGVTGLLGEDLLDLRAQPLTIWDEIREAPAAALGSCRKKMTPDDVARAVELCRKHDIRYFFYIGGNDSMDTAQKMSAAAQSAGFELRVAGIPKTIDNDLRGTDFCPGYGSCARFIAQATIDLAMDIRAPHADFNHGSHWPQRWLDRRRSHSRPACRRRRPAPGLRARGPRGPIAILAGR